MEPIYLVGYGLVLVVIIEECSTLVRMSSPDPEKKKSGYLQVLRCSS